MSSDVGGHKFQQLFQTVAQRRKSDRIEMTVTFQLSQYNTTNLSEYFQAC